MESTLFTKIYNGDIPGVLVWEDEKVFVLMDKFPSTPGQTLVIPKEQIDYILDLPDALYTHLWLVAKKIGHASQKAFHPRRVCFIVEGFDVPHVHIRVYPVPEGKPLDPHRGVEASDEVLSQQAEAIKANL